MRKVLFKDFRNFLRTCKIESYDLHIQIMSHEDKLLNLIGKFQNFDFRENYLYINMDNGTCYINLVEIDSIHEHNEWFYIKLKNNIEYRICDRSGL